MIGNLTGHIDVLKDFKSKNIDLKEVLDIGAYEGEWTYHCKQIYPEANVLMIEANADMEEHLKKIGPYKIELLSSETDKEVVFHKSLMTHKTGSSIYPENVAEHKFEEVKLKTKKLSDVVESKNYDLIKLDTQGSDLDIINGSKSIFENTKYLMIETQTLEYNLGAPLFDFTYKYLKDLSFKLEHIYNFESQTFTNINTTFNMSFDMLWINERNL